jgi:O-antigen ligase/tetratricopeptide (TPR) repeat protein
MAKIIRWVTYGALFLIPFLPLVVANSFFFPFITGKNFGFRILVEIALAGWLALMFIDVKYRPRFSWTAAIFGLFVIWMAIADAFAVNPAKAFWSNFERMDGWVTLIHVFLFFLITGSIFAADNLWRKWWYTFLGVAGVICAYSFLQVGGVLAIHQGGVRVDASFGNAEYLAAYLLFTIAISVWLAFEAKQQWLKWLLGVFVVLQIIVLFLTETRGAILGFIGAVGLTAILWMFEAGKKGRRYAMGMLGALALLVIIFFALRTSPIIQDIPGLDRLASISASNSESTTRLTIWHMALEGFEQKPIVGWGQEGFNYVFNKYYEPSLYAQEPWFDRAHDIFLDWLVAGGLPALVLFVALLAAAVVAIYRAPNVSRVERLMLISTLAAYCFQGLFVFDNLFTYVPLAIILAMIHSVSSRPITKIGTKTNYVNFENWKVVSEEQFQTIVVPVAIIAMLAVIWVVNVPNMRAAYDLIPALTPNSDPNAVVADYKQAYADGSFGNQEISEQLMTYATGIAADQTVSNADKQTVFTYALAQMQNTVTLIPNDARLRLEYALGFRSAGDYPDAIKESQVAVQLSPKKQSILVEEGIEYLQSGNVTQARIIFNQAYSLAPADTSVAPYAAAGDILGGYTPQGKSVLQQSFGTTTVDQQILMLAYYTVKDYPDLIVLLQQQVIDQNNSASAMFELAAAYANAGDIVQARAEVQSAITLHPEDATEGAQLLAQIPAK